MTTWHCEYAWVDGACAAGVRITVAGERIAAIETAAAATDDRRLAGVTIPGLANAHSHVFHRALRGRTHEGRGDFWVWREAMYAVANRLDPDSFYALARTTYAEMVLAGFTAVGEFHYVHHQPGGVPYTEPNAMSASLVAAAADAGIRLTLLDTCYLRGGFDAPLAPEQLRFGDADVDAWAARATARSEAPGLRLGAAVHSVRAVAPEAMAVVAETARAHGWPLHIHVSEQPAENEAALAHTGRTPVALAAEAGVLGPATTAIHATHVDDDDIRCLAEADTGVCLCPTTEADLGDGIADTVGLWQVPVCIGTDSHACIDGFEEARRIELDTRLRRQRRGVFPAAALLDAATAHGHAALGWDAGRLTPGALADFVTLDITSPRLAGFDAEHAAAHVVFAAAAADVRTVVVGGRVVADR